MRARLKLNEIRSVIKMGSFNNKGQVTVSGSLFKQVAEEVLAVKRFITVRKN